MCGCQNKHDLPCLFRIEHIHKFLRFPQIERLVVVSEAFDYATQPIDFFPGNYISAFRVCKLPTHFSRW